MLLLLGSIVFSPFYLLLLILVVDKKEGDGTSHLVVMPAPSKRGRKKKTTLSKVGPVGGPGNETLILAHLTAGGQVRKYRCRKGNLILT